ncbi:MAG: DNA repair and recombination protein RadB [Candidatus Altarchaeum sp.]|nr:DNA repair and recombination protein RadB [Candidatus Altarchaeum sp.]
MINIEKNFDEIFGGGILEKCLTQIYGPPASGKTNLCIIAAVFVALREKKIIFIDTEGGFSVERIKQIANEKAASALKNIILIEPTTYEEQKTAIDGVEKMMQERIGLIIVDSITMLYRLEEANNIDERQERQILLGKQLEILLRTSRKFNIPIIMTNQVYTDIETKEISPVGGEILKYWCKVIVEVGKENLNDRLNKERFAIIKKHKFIKEGPKLLFKIIEEGIVVEK